MIETARKEDLFLDSKLIIPENRLDAIRIMARLHPVVGDQPTNEKDQPNTNNPVLDLACTILNIHEKGIGVHADLRPIQNEPPSYFYGKGFMSGISNLKGNGILAVYGHWRDGSGRYAIKQFYYTDKEILWRNAVSDTAWSAWFDVLTGNSSLDYNKLLNVPITSTLSDSKTQIASIFTVNEVNRKAVTAQKTANEADAKAVAAMNEAEKKMLPFNRWIGDEHLNDIQDLGKYAVSSSRFITSINGYPNYSFRGTVVVEVSRWANNVLLQELKTEDVTFRRRFYTNDLNAPNNDIWEMSFTTYNTSNIKGFLRSSGNLIPLTEDQITSSLSDSKTNPASIFIVNEVNRAVVIAQQSANNANEKANKAQQDATKGINDAKTAQERADAAFSRVKPIEEGGTGATTAVNARKNLGLGDASTRNVATELNSNGNTLVPISLLKANMSKYALLEFGTIKNNITSTIKSPFGTEPVITTTEVFVDGKWMKAGWFGLGNSSSGMFTYGAESYLDIDEIRVVSGTHGVTYMKNYSPNTSTKHLLEGLIRVHVWKI